MAARVGARAGGLEDHLFVLRALRRLGAEN
jgi:hypothetical protein